MSSSQTRDIAYRPVSWALIVPLKDFARAKTRITGISPPMRRELARALARDTIRTASATVGAPACFVVSSPSVSDELRRRPGCRDVNFVNEPLGGGLNASLVRGRDTAVAAGFTAVAMLVADLPLLSPPDLRAALAMVNKRRAVVVRDADGRGTTLLASRSAGQLSPAFGDDSAARHIAAGAVDMTESVADGVRFDVDFWADVVAAAKHPDGLASETAAWLRSMPGAMSAGLVARVD